MLARITAVGNCLQASGCCRVSWQFDVSWKAISYRQLESKLAMRHLLALQARHSKDAADRDDSVCYIYTTAKAQSGKHHSCDDGSSQIRTLEFMRFAHRPTVHR